MTDGTAFLRVTLCALLVACIPACSNRDDARSRATWDAGDSAGSDGSVTVPDAGHAADARTSPPDAALVECTRTQEFDRDPSTPGYDTLTTMVVDRDGRKLRSEVRDASGALLSTSTYTSSGDTTFEDRDEGADGTIDVRSSETRVYDDVGRLSVLERDEDGDGSVDHRSTFRYEGTSMEFHRRDDQQLEPTLFESYSTFEWDAAGRIERQRFPALPDAPEATATWTYEDPTLLHRGETFLDIGSDGEADLSVRWIYEVGCEIEVRPEDVLI